MSTAPTPSPRTVDCPPPPHGCAATAGEPCLSHGGTRVRRNYHQARTAAWEAARVAAVPAVKLITDAGPGIRHGKHAAALLREHGHHADADCIEDEVKARNGLMSAKQAVAFLIEAASGERR
ncbi:hypothetical protein KMT30_05840 [Streptomyces sp. IBSBF 2953]|nr:hypothetical protein [Streptomyces hayashii]